jgi:hypothetical protein
MQIRRIYVDFVLLLAHLSLKVATALTRHADKYEMKEIPSIDQEVEVSLPSDPVQVATEPQNMIDNFKELSDTAPSYRAVNDYYASHDGSAAVLAGKYGLPIDALHLPDSYQKVEAKKLAAGEWVGVLKRDANPNLDEPMATGVTSISRKLRKPHEAAKETSFDLDTRSLEELVALDDARREAEMAQAPGAPVIKVALKRKRGWKKIKSKRVEAALNPTNITVAVEPKKPRKTKKPSKKSKRKS